RLNRQRMDAVQVVDEGKDSHAAGDAAESGRGEPMPFEAAECERGAREFERHSHPIYHMKRRLRSRYCSPRHPQTVQATAAESDTESVEQIECSDSGHRKTARERDARYGAGTYDCEAGCSETQGRRRLQGCETRAPARQQW